MCWPAAAPARAEVGAASPAEISVEESEPTEYREITRRMFIEHAGGMPALCRAGNGDLLFVHGTVWELVPTNGVLKLYRSRDEGKTWAKPTTVVRSKAKDWNVTFWSCLHRMPDDSLILGYSQLWTPKRKGVPETEKRPSVIWDIALGNQKAEAYIIRSTDHGATWSAPVRVAPELTKCWVGGRPVTAPDGSVLVPMVRLEKDSAAFFVRSRDNGKTWGRAEPTAPSQPGLNETSMGVAADGRILAVFRDIDIGPRRRFRQAESKDSGRTWSHPRLTPFIGKMPDMLVLPSGRILLAVGSFDCMDGAFVFDGPPGSSYAGLLISDDHGRTWQRDVRFTSPDPKHLVPFDAPVLARLKDGRILAISFCPDRRSKDDPLLGWSRGYHYVIHELAPNKASSD